MAGIVQVDRRRAVSDAVVQQHMDACAHLPVYRTAGQESGPVVVCAAGPSLLQQIPMIRGLQKCGLPVCAVKGVADVLLEHGIVPAYAVFMDPKADQLRFFDNPHPDITYLMCTQTHPDVFAKLSGFKVLTWHGQCKDHAQKMVESERCGAIYINAVTTGVAAVNLMRSFGFSRQHWFGFDCSYDGQIGHVYAKPKEKAKFQAKVGGRVFTTDMALLDQHNFLTWLMVECPELPVTIYGDGALQESAKQLAKVLSTPYDYMLTTIDKPDDDYSDAEAAA